MEASYADQGLPGDGGSSSFWSHWQFSLSSKYQQCLDKSTPHTLWRWLSVVVIALIYCIRVYYLQGFYIVTYGLGIYLLNLLIGFLSPQVDPDSEGPTLPSKGTDEFKPFIRRLPEFKFWYSLTKAFCVAFVMTFFSIFDVPVFWPILLIYWVVLFVLTMKRQLRHMIKYKYIPFDLGKQRYTGKASSSDKATAMDFGGGTDSDIQQVSGVQGSP